MPTPSTDNAYHPTSPSFHLSASDVEMLLRDDSADTRVKVLEKVSSEYNSETLRPSEAVVAEQIFRLMMKDVEVRVREVLARNVKGNPSIPRDIILHLAKDIETVAMPVLEASEVLSDADLIQIVESSREVGKLVAISKRPRVSSRVSDSLVETHYPQVVKSLLSNKGAQISEESYTQIIEEFSNDSAITEAMVKRAKLPVRVVEKLIQHVSVSLAQELQNKYHIGAASIQAEAKETREEATLSMLSADMPQSSLDELAMQMLANGRLTPSIILTALCRGHLGFFETALSKLARIPVVNVRKLLLDRGALGFPALYEKTGLPESLKEAVRILLSVVRELQGNGQSPGTVNYANRVVEQLLSYAGEREVDNLPYIIALIRQNVAH